MKNVKTTSKEKVYLHNNGNFVLVFQKSPKNYDFSKDFSKKANFFGSFFGPKSWFSFFNCLQRNKIEIFFHSIEILNKFIKMNLHKFYQKKEINKQWTEKQ